MRTPCLASLIIIGATTCLAHGYGTLSTEQQIAAAVLPLPAVLRDHASVILFDKHEAPVIARKGTNDMICMLIPSSTEFDARCYHSSFMPVILRGRELRNSGMKSKDVAKTIDNEIQHKKLNLPDHPIAGYRMLGPISAYDQKTNTAGNAIESWQSIHFPYKTAKEIGLPVVGEVPRTVPYVMASGTYWCHVMIEHSPAEQAEARDGNTTTRH
jgi:hypothetical protein